ncbi:teratocarcinoma-derived growth factor 1-like [Vulpes lagopus]|uniref:teratocarcinoma-derived growth factor 1-like n=1 Tax=Vulpes lagopus TaxID=494514 RepID=UPI001BCA5D52|nr:teratocarcinoma-derived growth factor 1-like [Vulpes lagopus]
MGLRKMERFSCRVILIMTISKAFELELVAGLGHRELSRREETAFHHRASHFVPSIGIQDSKELNKTCCLNGGTCMLGSFCASPPPFYGRNCEHDSRKENCESVPHDTWLPKRCSMCKCWCGRLHCFPRTFLPGCDGHVMDEHFLVSSTPRLTLSSGTTFLLAGICLALQSYC